MSESGEVFFNRTLRASGHTQYDEIKDFYQLCKENKAISGIGDDELDKLVKDLENDHVEKSNDMVIEMILNYVMENTKNQRTLDILSNLKVANIPYEKAMIGRAYPQYTDGSYYIEIDSNILKRIQLLSDIFAIFFMYNESIGEIEESILKQLLKANILRYNNNVNFNNEFNLIQIKMMIYDRIFESSRFTDKYISYSREIEEIGTATLLGHEVGHHYYGHTEKPTNDKETLKSYEFLADRYSVDFSFEYLKSAYTYDGNNYGLHQFASVYIPLIASSFYGDVHIDGVKHPSIVKRINIIRKKLSLKIESEAFQEVDKYINVLYQNIGFNILK
ncbi:MAG: hypothetical protein ACERKV_06770 [Clostridiaceae bacterium]